MKNIKSRVYPDTILQTALKDILIPILMGRDVSKPFGEYTRDIEDLKNRVTALEIPDKSKLFRHSNFRTPIYVALPERSYADVNEEFYEPVIVEIECEISDTEGGKRTIEVGILIPAYYSSENQGHYGKKPLVLYCSQDARDLLGTIVVKARRNPSANPQSVYEIYFPKVVGEVIDRVNSIIVTIASENRNTTKADWNTETSNAAATLAQNEMILGMVAIEPPIPDRDKLVYSDNVRSLLSITKGTFKYVQDTEQTQPTTLYFTREDKDSRGNGRINIRDPREIKTNYSVLTNIFGKDWSGIEFEFDDDVRDISEAFAGLDITNSPKALIGKNIVTADKLFKGSNITRITDQDSLLKDMPKLNSGSEMFADCTSLTGEIKKTLIRSNTSLTVIDYMFKNTKITNTEELWNMVHRFQPPRDPMLRPDAPPPPPTINFISGRGCFEGVTTLINISSVPEFWKTSSTHFTYKSKEEFTQLRDHLLRSFNNDLSTITLEFAPVDDRHINLENLFSSTEITHTPLTVISPNATSASNMFAHCTKLIHVSDTVISSLTALTDITGLFMYDEELTSLPQTLLYNNKAITNFNYAFSGLTSITGDTPKGEGGVDLWSLAGRSGYPSEISGNNCFADSSFDNIASVPDPWKGGD